MSSVISIDDFSTNNVSESSSQNNSCVQTSSDGSLQEHRKKLSAEEIYNFLPTARSVEMKISPTSTAANSIDGKIESTFLKKIEDEETSNKNNSLTSHTLRSHGEKSSSASNKGLTPQLCQDLYLPLAEEQNTVTDIREARNLIATKGFTNNGDLTENLLSAILAFKETSQNQYDILNAQTSAINRLAAAIEDQNIIMSRFHNVIHKSSTKNPPANDETSND